MGYQNIAALFILLPRMEQTVEEQKKKKAKQKSSRISYPIGIEASCQAIVLVCVYLLPVYIRPTPPHPPLSTLHPQAAVTWKGEVESCQNLQALACHQSKNNSPPGVDHVWPLASLCSTLRLLRWAEPERRGNAVICYLRMYTYIPFYDPIHAQFARLYSRFNRGWAGAV